MKTQRQSILESNAPIHKIGGRLYKGRPPEFAPIGGALGSVVSYRKIRTGIPFVLVVEDN